MNYFCLPPQVLYYANVAVSTSNIQQNKRPTIAMPPNEVEVKLIFTRRRSAKVMGKLAEAPVETDADDADMEIPNDDDDVEGKDKKAVEPRAGEAVRGILVTQQNSSKIVAPEDLSTYTPLRVGSVSSRLHVPFVGKIETLRLFLNEMFRGIDESNEGGDDEGDEGVVTFSMHGGQVSSNTRMNALAYKYFYTSTTHSNPFPVYIR